MATTEANANEGVHSLLISISLLMVLPIHPSRYGNFKRAGLKFGGVGVWSYQGNRESTNF